MRHCVSHLEFGSIYHAWAATASEFKVRTLCAYCDYHWSWDLQRKSRTLMWMVFCWVGNIIAGPEGLGLDHGHYPEWSNGFLSFSCPKSEQTEKEQLLATGYAALCPQVPWGLGTPGSQVEPIHGYRDQRCCHLNLLWWPSLSRALKSKDQASETPVFFLRSFVVVVMFGSQTLVFTVVFVFSSSRRGHSGWSINVSWILNQWTKWLDFLWVGLGTGNKSETFSVRLSRIVQGPFSPEHFPNLEASPFSIPNFICHRGHGPQNCPVTMPLPFPSVV